MTKKVLGLLKEIVGILLSLIIVLPLLLILVNSFKSYGEANKLSLGITGISLSNIITNYKTVLETSALVTGYKNSLIVTALSTVMIIVFASTSAFIINRRKQKFIGYINTLIIIGMTLPVSMVPTYFVVKQLGLNHSYFGISFVYLAINYSFAVFLFAGYYKSVPSDIDESAIIDGCSVYRLFFQVIFPLVKPVTVTVLISEVMTMWNDFTVAIFLLNSPKRFTAVLTTYAFFGAKQSDWNLLFADVVLISLPVIILYLFLQRYIVSGLTAGAVKG